MSQPLPYAQRKIDKTVSFVKTLSTADNSDFGKCFKLNRECQKKVFFVFPF